MASEEEFKTAVDSVNGLSTPPDNQTLLKLYAAYKQATSGDVSGRRPGMLDVRGRAKFEAWSKLKGMSPEDARASYVSEAKRLTS